MKSIEIIDELYKIYNFANEELFDGELPEVLITLVKGVSPTNSFYGKYCGKAYKNNDNQDSCYEIQIAGEFLADYYTLCDTIVHEMCHLYCAINKIKDVNKKYHNDMFESVARTHGLNAEYVDEKIGFSNTSLTDESKELFDTLEIDKDKLKYCRNYNTESKKPPKKRYICPHCGLQVQAKKSSLIKCGSCDMFLDYWDLTTDEPKLLVDLNDGYALSENGWLNDGNYSD